MYFMKIARFCIETLTDNILDIEVTTKKIHAHAGDAILLKSCTGARAELTVDVIEGDAVICSLHKESPAHSSESYIQKHIRDYRFRIGKEIDILNARVVGGTMWKIILEGIE